MPGVCLSFIDLLVGSSPAETFSGDEESPFWGIKIMVIMGNACNGRGIRSLNVLSYLFDSILQSELFSLSCIHLFNEFSS